ncbi:hypothetical protein TNCV_4690211 [Trichonephila clavipes]|nr:hypothetical protein TNCV_4690211 [Trichonephila clavipes]
MSLGLLNPHAVCGRNRKKRLLCVVALLSWSRARGWLCFCRIMGLKSSLRFSPTGDPLVEGLMCVKSAMAQSTHVAWEWKFGE